MISLVPNKTEVEVKRDTWDKSVRSNYPQNASTKSIFKGFLRVTAISTANSLSNRPLLSGLGITSDVEYLLYKPRSVGIKRGDNVFIASENVGTGKSGGVKSKFKVKNIMRGSTILLGNDEIMDLVLLTQDGTM